MSVAGRDYRAANGTKIRNHGQTDAAFMTSEGEKARLVFQIADVERVLIGATPLTAAGHEVQLRDESGAIVHRESGRSIALTRKGGVFILSMYFLVKDDGSPADSASAEGFAR